MFIMLPPLLYGQNKLVEESIIYSSDISSYKKKIEKTIFFIKEGFCGRKRKIFNLLVFD